MTSKREGLGRASDSVAARQGLKGYRAPTLTKGPLLSLVTAGDSLVSVEAAG
jgi:hypothetical protein